MMRFRCCVVRIALGSMAGLFGSGAAIAGDLNPPAGPIAPTMKDLVEVEPRIAINAINTPGDPTSTFIIAQPGSYYLAGNINGEVGKTGIACTVVGVTIDLNGFEVVGVPGSVAGIRMQGRSQLFNGTVRDWGLDGVQGFGRCIISNVQSHDNADHGFSFGFSFDRFSDCSATDNGEQGFRCGSEAIVERCTSTNNMDHGFSANGLTVIRHCIAQGNSGDGFNLTNGSDGARIEGCASRGNNGDGIEVRSGVMVISNRCEFAGSLVVPDQAGIRVTSTGNYIDGNFVSFNDIGLIVEGADNFVIRNFALSNAVKDLSILAGNTQGPVFTGPGDINTANAWSNVEAP